MNLSAATGKRSIRMKKILVMGLLMLTGCVTNDEQCQRWGAEPGTSTYVQCMATLSQRDAANNAAGQAAASSAQAQQAARQAQLQQFMNWNPR